MRTFTVRPSVSQIDDSIAVTADGIPVGADGTFAPVAAALRPTTREPHSIKRASVVATLDGLRVIAERRDDRRSKTQNALVLIDVAQTTPLRVGFTFRCPSAVAPCKVETTTRFLRRKVTVFADTCPTCGRSLTEGAHPALDAPVPRSEQAGVLTVAAAERSADCLAVLRPGASIAVLDEAITAVHWDGVNLSLS